MNIHIFGAAAGIGKWLVKNVFTGGVNVFAYDIDKKIDVVLLDYGNVVPCFLDIGNSVEGDFLKKYAGEFNDGDIFVLAIPKSELSDTIKCLKLHFPTGALCAVATSTQYEALSLLKEVLGEKCVLGFHPLFGPTVKNTYGQLVALCDYRKDCYLHDSLRGLLVKSGLQISVLSAKEHDKYMSYVQVLTHFILLSFMDLISKEEFSLDDLIKVKTPPFQLLSAFASRMLLGSPLTYASIQDTDQAKMVRDKLIGRMIKLNECFDSSDVNRMSNRIENIKAPFSGPLLEELSQFSILSVNAVQELEK